MMPDPGVRRAAPPGGCTPWRIGPLAVAVSALVTLSLAPSAARAQAVDTVFVDVTTGTADTADRPLGINLNYLVDGDSNRRGGRPLAAALEEMNVRYLRFPGGEKSDGYLWSVPPFDRPDPALARTGPGEWPSGERRLVENDGTTFATDPMDFDEFMVLCRRIDCEPVLVVAHAAMYRPPVDGGTAPTRAQLLRTAAAWVHYANVVRGYGVRYWMIGNESWMEHYHGTATAEQYARDLVAFSRAMKSVDPDIRIGANGSGVEWWKTILEGAGGEIDFLAVHAYPMWELGDYRAYREMKHPDFTREIRIARAAIAAFAPEAARDRLKIAITETNAFDWSEGGWPSTNDLGHALVLLDMFGAYLQLDDVSFSLLWNTRWVHEDEIETPRLSDALDPENRLQATGRVLEIWGEVLSERMVVATTAGTAATTGSVRPYATHSPTSGALHLLLINRDTARRTAAVELEGYAPAPRARRRVFTGEGPEDPEPRWRFGGTCTVPGPAFRAALPPLSVTVIELLPISWIDFGQDHGLVPLGAGTPSCSEAPGRS